MRTTMSQIAKVSGVSTATVDRVLNDRPGVRKRTRDIVTEVATKLGYYGPVNVAPEVPVKLDFILPAGDNSFMQLLVKHLFQVFADRPRVNANLHQIEGFKPDKLAEYMLSLVGRTQGVGVVALDHPTVREAADTLIRSGVKVATLVSDLNGSIKSGYIGIDNRAAGRLAGQLLGRFLPSDSRHEIAVFAGSLAYRGHEEREMGFRHIIGDEFDHLRISRLIEIRDDRARAYGEARKMLQDGAISGIYNIGAGNQGIARAVKELGKSRDVVFVGHDLTDASRLLLLDGTMDALIDQNPRVLAREVVRLLISEITNEGEPEYLPRLQAIFRENIPRS